MLRKPTWKNRKRCFTEAYKECEVGQFGSSEAEIRRFAAVIKVLHVLIVNLRQDKTTTKRDIYYQDVGLFQRSQAYANELIECVSGSLNLSAEEDLKIFASQKGLMFGNVQLKCGPTLWDFHEPVLIPRVFDLEMAQPPDAIVVIEKEAVFKSFCEYIASLDLKLIAVTGKGFPDRLTKRFVESLGRMYPEVPMLAFMDSDVYGLSICKNYKYGTSFDTMACPQMKYAGVFLLEYTKGWLDISTRDWKMMGNFVRDIKYPRPCSEPEAKELHKWHRELTRGLVLFKKSEMNIVDSCPNEYILRKIRDHVR